MLTFIDALAVFLILNIERSTAASINASSISAVVVGKSVELCLKTAQSTIYLDYSPPFQNKNFNLSWTRIYNGVELRPEYAINMNVTRADRKLCLHIERARLNNSGFYKYIYSKSSGSNENILNSSKSTSFLQISSDIIIKLNVLLSDPQCSINKETFKEGEDIVFQCSVNYTGSTDPIMECNGMEMNGNTSELTLQDVSQISTSILASTLKVSADLNQHNAQYSCKMHFNQSVDVDERIIVSPRFLFTWKSPNIRVLHSPRNLRIIPLKNVYYPGESFQCFADAFPDPSYSWKNMETKVIVSGQDLQITEDMVRNKEHTYECIVYYNGTWKSVNENITFSVKAWLSIPYVVSSALGILSLLLVFAVLAVNRKHMKELIAKLIGGFRRQNQIQPNIGAENNFIEDLAEEPVVRRKTCGNYVRAGCAPNNLNPKSASADGSSFEGELSAARCHQERNIQKLRYYGADGTEYMEMNGFRPSSNSLPPIKPPLYQPALYATIDHMRQPPLPPK